MGRKSNTQKPVYSTVKQQGFDKHTQKRKKEKPIIRSLKVFHPHFGIMLTAISAEALIFLIAYFFFSLILCCAGPVSYQRDGARTDSQ